MLLYVNHVSGNKPTMPHVRVGPGNDGETDVYPAEPVSLAAHVAAISPDRSRDS